MWYNFMIFIASGVKALYDKGRFIYYNRRVFSQFKLNNKKKKNTGGI